MFWTFWPHIATTPFHAGGSLQPDQKLFLTDDPLERAKAPRLSVTQTKMHSNWFSRLLHSFKPAIRFSSQEFMEHIQGPIRALHPYWRLSPALVQCSCRSPWRLEVQHSYGCMFSKSFSPYLRIFSYFLFKRLFFFSLSLLLGFSWGHGNTATVLL